MVLQFDLQFNMNLYENTAYIFVCFQLQFKEASRGRGAVADSGPGYPVPCYPLETLLLALNVTKVDFISLDVEGQEVPILKTIPFDKVTVNTDK